MIVAAAVPLLVEYGAAVSTLQIAKAAGIGEATIFRAFADKDELLDACVAAVLRNEQVLAEMDAVPLDQPLADRLTEAAATLRAYLDRMGAVIGAVHAAGGRRLERRGLTGGGSARGDEGGGGTSGSSPAVSSGGAFGHGHGGREEAVRRTLQAVVRLLEPDRDKLRLPVDKVAALFLGMLFPRPVAGGAETSVETLVDVFLYGAAVDPA